MDGPGLATPVLTRVPWRHVTRPIWPLDPDMSWRVPDQVAVNSLEASADAIGSLAQGDLAHGAYSKLPFFQT